MARHKINKRKKEKEMQYRLDGLLKSCSQVWARSCRLWRSSDTCKEQASVSGVVRVMTTSVGALGEE